MSIEFFDRRGTGAIKWDRAKGDVLPLWVADMDIASPPAIVEALRKRLDHPVFGYTDPDEEFYRAFADWAETRQGWRPEGDWQIFAPAMMPAVRALIAGFSQPGEGVIVQPPVYFPFFSAVTDQDRVVLENPLVQTPGGGYQMNLPELEELAARKETRVLLLCSPHNPVGRVWSREELLRVVEIALDHNLVVVVDEIHADLILPGFQFESLGRFLRSEDGGLNPAADCIVVLQSPGKTFNIPGLASCQAIAAGKELRAGVKRAFSRAGFDISNIFSIEAAKAGYRFGGPWLDEVLQLIAANRQLLVEGINRWPGYGPDSPGVLPAEVSELGKSGFGVSDSGGIHPNDPRMMRLAERSVVPAEGTYLAWVDVRPLCELLSIKTQVLHMKLNKEAGVLLSSGPQFGTGGEGFLRINLACSPEILTQALNRIEGWLKDSVKPADPGSK